MDSIRFECVRCGNCCKVKGHTILTVEDIRLISLRFNMSTNDFLIYYCYIYRRNIISDKNEIIGVLDEIALKKNNDICPFIKNNVCSIQETKPLFCESYPFIASIEYLKYCMTQLKYCTGFLSGKIYSNEYILELINKNNDKYYQCNAEIIQAEYDWGILFPEAITLLTVVSEDIIKENIYNF